MSWYTLKRPPWWRILARHRWDRTYGQDVHTAVIETQPVGTAAKRRARKRSMKGVVGG